MLALERPGPRKVPRVSAALLRAEALRVWDLQQSGALREIYFRQDRPAAVLILECRTVAEARQVLNTLPLVRARVIAFDLVPLAAYPGFARLWSTPGTRPPLKAVAPPPPRRRRRGSGTRAAR